MKAQITHTIECRKCQHPIDFDFPKMISILVQGKSVNLVCSACNFPNPNILTGSPDCVTRFLKIEKELNDLLIKRLKEDNFLRVCIVSPKPL
jgi:hypothetical protein